MTTDLQVIHTKDPVAVRDHLLAFEKYIEPMIRILERHKELNSAVRELPELQAYLEMCRRPLHKVEIAFALQFLLAYLKPGDRYLDAGCGITPLPHLIAAQNITTHACDRDEALITGLKKLNFRALFGTKVNYAAVDLTHLYYANHCFDAISCVAVIEQIETPDDQIAIRELLRVLKPGGLLVITLDFRPTPAGMSPTNNHFDGYSYYMNRLAHLVGNRELVELYCSAYPKHEARNGTRHHTAHYPRTVNDAFTGNDAFTAQLIAADQPVHHRTTALFSEIPYHPQSHGRTLLPVAVALQKPY